MVNLFYNISLNHGIKKWYPRWYSRAREKRTLPPNNLKWSLRKFEVVALRSNCPVLALIKTAKMASIFLLFQSEVFSTFEPRHLRRISNIFKIFMGELLELYITHSWVWIFLRRLNKHPEWDFYMFIGIACPLMWLFISQIKFHSPKAIYREDIQKLSHF